MSECRHDPSDRCRRVGPLHLCKERLHTHVHTHYAGRVHQVFVDIVVLAMLVALVLVVAQIIQLNRRSVVPTPWSASVQTISLRDGQTAHFTLQYTTPEGEQIGGGSAVPAVGERTTIWFLARFEGIHTESVTHLFVDLGDRVAWTGVAITQGSDAAVSEEGNTIHLTFCSGRSCARQDAAVKLVVTPEPGDAGKPLDIITGGRLLVDDPVYGRIEVPVPKFLSPFVQ